MAAQRYKDNLFSYSGLIASNTEIEKISDYLAGIQEAIAQADYSEVIDLRKYTITRNALKIRRMLRGKKDYPFVFVSCLN